MDAKRAQEIIKAPQIIDVKYDNDPVWLNHVNADNTVNIRPLRYAEGHQIDVPAAKLQEIGTSV